MKKLLFVTGLTATGKTAFAARVAALLNGEIVNGDSRQVYIGMDIGTGKDLPELKKLNIHYRLLNEVHPDEEWSVSHAVRAMRQAITEIWNGGKLPIVVGGTGQYLSYVERAPKDIAVPQNLQLRAALHALRVEELRNRLSQRDPRRFAAMNASDRKNPRRLIRALEIFEWKHGRKQAPKLPNLRSHDTLWIGMRAPLSFLSENIRKRIDARLDAGMLEEVRTLIKAYPSWTSLPAFSSTGYRECRDYIDGKLSKEDLVSLWLTHELQYAKRQETWFKRQKDIVWFDISRPSALRDMENLAKNWYDRGI